MRAGKDFTSLKSSRRRQKGRCRSWTSAGITAKGSEMSVWGEFSFAGTSIAKGELRGSRPQICGSCRWCRFSSRSPALHNPPEETYGLPWTQKASKRPSKGISGFQENPKCFSKASRGKGRMHAASVRFRPPPGHDHPDRPPLAPGGVKKFCAPRCQMPLLCQLAGSQFF